MRRAAAVVAAVLAATTLAACAEEQKAAPYPNAPGMSFAEVLALAPATASTIAYTHWSALGHRTTGYATKTTTSSEVRNADRYRDAVGVGAADPDWQLELSVLPDGARTASIYQWSDGAGLARFVASLRSHGWQQSIRGGRLMLVRSEPLSDDGWEWAHASRFVVDTARGVVARYGASDPSPLGGGARVLAQPGVRAAIAADPNPVTGQLRSGSEDVVCPQYGIKDLNPEPPASYVRSYAVAIGTLGPLRAVHVAITSADGRTGSLTAVATTAAQAARELATRQRAALRIPTRDDAVAVSKGTRSGAADVFTLRGTAPIDLYTASHDHVFGADSCGLN